LGERLSVAVDDIQILEYACPGDGGAPLLDCDFERDTCAWWNVADHALPSTEDNIDWLRRTAAGGGDTLGGPPSDNTLGSNVGYYLLMEATGRENAKAVLASQPLEANVSYCMTWYSWSGDAETRIHYHDLATLEVGEVCNAWTCSWTVGGNDHWEQVHI
jgi:hypothetical protein